VANVKKFLHLDSDGQLREQTATDTIQVANGVNALDAINKGQLDSAVGSLTDLITAEAARATQAEAALGDSLTAETAARVAAGRPDRHRDQRPSGCGFGRAGCSYCG